MKALALVVLAGCLPSSSVVCGDGRICPDDQVCAHVTDPAQDLCADPAQLQACDGRPRYAHCGATARCYDGICLAVSCGNGRIDRGDPADPLDQGEVCDDGNERSGDGCSSDCRSDETCGNGVVDSIALERCDDGDRLSNDGCDSVCQPERGRWRQLALAPPYRIAQAFTYDLLRDRMVMFGGALQDGTVLGETWEGTPTGFALVAPGQAPSPRVGSTMAYDIARRRVVLFGGASSGQTWIWDGTAWSESIVIDGPSPRHDHAMAYDARRGRTVLFGGHAVDSLGLDHQTWEWDGTAWTQRTPATVPPGRAGHAMAYDARRGVIVMWGGILDSSVWEYDGIDWHEVRPSGVWPHDRDHPSLAWDPVRERIMMVGGDKDGTEQGDVWTWDGAAWASLGALAPKISARHVMTTDLRRGRVVLFGASDVGLGLGAVATWTWDGTAWSYREVATSGDPITTSAVLDPLRGRIVMLGFLETAELDGFGWSGQTRDPGAQRTDSALAYDAARRKTMLFGGLVGNSNVLGDTWSLETSDQGDQWVELHPPSSPPPRVDAGLAYFPKTRGVVMFGGAACPKPSCDVFADTWQWNGLDWSLVSSEHQPPPRGHAVFAYDPIHGEIVLFGGAVPNAADPNSPQTKLDDTWTWDGVDWTEQHPSVRPSARADAAMAWDANRGRLVLHGGTSTLSFANDDVWEWDGATWIRTVVTDSPIRTRQAVASAIGAGIVSLGGVTSPGHPTSEVDALRWEGTSPGEACRSNIDGDGDGLAGCADPDCWWACAPLCPPGAPCDPATPHCGDGECNAALEDGWICPADCARPVICGDAICDPGETGCRGDCP